MGLLLQMYIKTPCFINQPILELKFGNEKSLTAGINMFIRIEKYVKVRPFLTKKNLSHLAGLTMRISKYFPLQWTIQNLQGQEFIQCIL